MAYGKFAGFYDELTLNAGYDERAGYYASILASCGIDGGILLDLGCGTGSMSVRMAKKGYSVIGADISPDMLMLAREKAYEAGADILFLNQDMTELDLYGTINACISVLDCINHLGSPGQVKKAFERVSLFTEPGGVFVFDVNTVYKHRNVLADNTFVYETDDVYCVWQNSLLPEDTVEITLDFFEKHGDSYMRESETFTERAYPLEDIRALLESSGFEVLSVYEDMKFTPVKEDSEKAVFVARKR
ncbi:MAG: methyltransferase domain-containing protein [Clostridia bacterium]|nr:methyltransferase domain-containing protein [Clostridia bacterium]